MYHLHMLSNLTYKVYTYVYNYTHARAHTHTQTRAHAHIAKKMLRSNRTVHVVLLIAIARRKSLKTLGLILVLILLVGSRRGFPEP